MTNADAAWLGRLLDTLTAVQEELEQLAQQQQNDEDATLILASAVEVGMRIWTLAPLVEHPRHPTGLRIIRKEDWSPFQPSA